MRLTHHIEIQTQSQTQCNAFVPRFTPHSMSTPVLPLCFPYNLLSQPPTLLSHLSGQTKPNASQM